LGVFAGISKLKADTAAMTMKPKAIAALVSSRFKFDFLMRGSL
jgi:hypothetical protein